MSAHVLLTFDVEEFDMPLEYCHAISLDRQFEISRAGLSALLPVIDSESTPCTLFTTANYARQFPDTIRQLAARHEIASHTFYHSSFKEEDLLASKKVLENITGKTVSGLRMPRMKKVDMSSVREAGYRYDSSLNPTFLPGRYNNFREPRTIFKQQGVIQIPASVSPVLRLPLFWLAFKNYPYKLFYQLCRQCIIKDGYVCLYFHPWEFTDIYSCNLPRFVERYCGDPMVQKLHQLMIDLKRDCDFSTMQSLAFAHEE